MKNQYTKVCTIIFCSISLFFSCQDTSTIKVADVIFINGNVYTVDEDHPKAEAIAVKDERIIGIGSNTDIEGYKGEDTQVIDLEGHFTMPGFIEGHGHFSGLGQSLINLNFLKAKSWSEIVAAVAEKAKDAEPGEWIVGRGWHQEKWVEELDQQVLGYPYHYDLSKVSPNNPVVLRHASGHGSFANAKAMELAGITQETPDPAGGEIVRDPSGEAIGMFEETAQRLVTQLYQLYLDSLSDDERKKRWLKGIEVAQQECLQKGVTSFQDAGSSFQDINWYNELAENGELDLRLWVMLRNLNREQFKNTRAYFDTQIDKLPIVNAGNHYFTCKSIKSAVDGALGSFGAWLLRPYNDKQEFVGQNTVTIEEVESIAQLSWEKGLQLCVHAIGDRANREVLNIFERTFATDPERKDHRWRIEHAQHLDTADIPRFREMGVIAAMQGIHCTSDAPFVVKRLGQERAKYGAYPWRSLIDAGVVVTNGTDAPVEDVDPIPSFYASVTRRRDNPDIVFFPEQSMTRTEAIHSYTLACAYSAFEEQDKGSLEVGKLADLVVLSNDLIQCSEEEILETKILMTIVGGNIKYQNTDQ